MTALCLVNISQECCQLFIEPKGFTHFSDRLSWFPSVHLMPTSVGFHLIWETNVFCPKEKKKNRLDFAGNAHYFRVAATKWRTDF